MPISHPHRCIFVHVPKTGGTSIETALGMHGRWQDENRETMFGLMRSADLTDRPRTSAFLQHLSFRELRELVGEEIAKRYFSFSFVRNPWDRMVSVYHNTDPHLIEHARGLGVELRGLSFAEFVARTAGVVHAHLTEHAHFLCDESGGVLVDFVGRFETLSRDFETVCRRLGVNAALPRLNASPHHDYRTYYDGGTRARVEKRYRRDIDLFGYTF